MPPDDDGWNEWREFVLDKLKVLESQYRGLDHKMDKLIEDVAGLKIKAGIWGLIAGAIPVVLGLAIVFIAGKI